MIKLTDEKRIKQILVTAIVIMSFSLVTIITMKLKTVNDEEIVIQNNGLETSEKPIIIDEMINSDVELFGIQRIEENIRNILLVIDETNENDIVVSSGFYIISLDLINNTTKTVSIYPHMMIDAFNRKNLVLSEVREIHGINSTVNIINNQFKLDISKYVIMDYSDLSYYMKQIGMEITEKLSESDQKSRKDTNNFQIDLMKLEVNPVSLYLMDNSQSKNSFDEYSVLTSLLNKIYKESRTSLVPVMTADIADNIYTRVDTNISDQLFHSVFMKIITNKRPGRTLQLPLTDTWAYYDQENKTVKPDTKNLLSIRGFLYN